MLVPKAVTEPGIVRSGGNHRENILDLEATTEPRPLGFKDNHRSILCLMETQSQSMLGLKAMHNQTLLKEMTKHLRAIMEPRPVGAEDCPVTKA